MRRLRRGSDSLRVCHLAASRSGRAPGPPGGPPGARATFFHLLVHGISSLVDLAGCRDRIFSRHRMPWQPQKLSLLRLLTPSTKCRCQQNFAGIHVHKAPTGSYATHIRLQENVVLGTRPLEAMLVCLHSTGLPAASWITEQCLQEILVIRVLDDSCVYKFNPGRRCVMQDQHQQRIQNAQLYLQACAKAARETNAAEFTNYK